MAEVKIVTDSTCDLPEEMKRLGVEVVALKVTFGEQSYRDGVDLTSDEFFRLLQSSPQIPRTSQPAPGDFAEVYRRLSDAGPPIVSLHISGKLSGTVESARLARDLVPEAQVRVVDTRLASLALGMTVMEAARVAAAGADVETVAAAAERYARRMHYLFVVDTLEYLQRNGRIGRAQALLGGLLNVKPILGLENGEVVPVDRVRGRSRALARVMELLAQRLPTGRPQTLGLCYSPGDVSDVRRALQEAYPGSRLVEGAIGPVIGAHVGPGCFGVCYYAEE